MPYYGFFDELSYGKCFNGTAGIFVNRFINSDNLLEMGFYYTEKGTRYIFRSNGGSYGITTGLNYLEIPLALYHYPNPGSFFCYRYGISFCYLLGTEYSIKKIAYRNYDATFSFGIRFKTENSRLFMNTPFLKNLQFLLKFDCSVLPVSIPKEIEAYNITQPEAYRQNEIQRNIGLTFSLQYYFNEFSR